MPVVTHIKTVITKLCLHFVNSTCQITNIYKDMKSSTASKLEELVRQTTHEDLDSLVGATSSRPFPSRGNARGNDHFIGNELVPKAA